MTKRFGIAPSPGLFLRLRPAGLVAGVAETELRSGNVSQAEGYVKRMIETLPDTPYARRAQQWLDNQNSATGTSRLICQTRHDPGGLKNAIEGQR